jgi:hypothetical protein
MAQIFISYSRSDEQFVERLLPLAKRLFPDYEFWYDDHISGGEDWWQRILDEIDRADLFIYLLSNESLESTYCQADFQEARRLRKNPPLFSRLRCNMSAKIARIRRINLSFSGVSFRSYDRSDRCYQIKCGFMTLITSIRDMIVPDSAIMSFDNI